MTTESDPYRENNPYAEPPKSFINRNKNAIATHAIALILSALPVIIGCINGKFAAGLNVSIVIFAFSLVVNLIAYVLDTNVFDLISRQWGSVKLALTSAFCGLIIWPITDNYWWTVGGIVAALIVVMLGLIDGATK